MPTSVKGGLRGSTATSDLVFTAGLSFGLSKFSDDFTPFFSNLKDHN